MEVALGGTARVRLPHYAEEDRAASRSWGSLVVNVLQRHLPDLPALLHGVPPPPPNAARSLW
jgi:hypothetical protein